MKKNDFLFLFLIFTQALFAQNTVGLLSYQPTKVYEGYNLLYPHGQPNVYLLDNCGEIVHVWEEERGFLPGNAVYILENGNLVKTKRRDTPPDFFPIWAGGGGETVEIRTWENELLASYSLNDSLFRLHHDVAPLPNGNILMIAWENKSAKEAFEAGRDTSLLSQGKVWSEAILEWNPTTDEIVWEWHAWDHLIQDFNSNASNYGSVSNHPELIDINYDEHNGHPDWLHINAIDYNPILDQIIVSVPYFNELWIIDHSTNTAEAATNIGGNSNRGGDLLYRWGNPMTYKKGDLDDKQLFFQHDTHWINPNATEDNEDFGKIALFNNRVGQDFSTANILKPAFDKETANYKMETGVFVPIDFQQTIVHPKIADNVRAASNAVSSVQILPNSNALICAGRWGYSYEINPENELVWEYITPIKAGQPAEQGTSLVINNNLTFRMKRYGMDFMGFADKDLSPKGYLEANPNEDFCAQLSVNTNEHILSENIKVFPNPATDMIVIDKGTNDDLKQAYICDMFGRKLQSVVLNKQQTIIEKLPIQSGLYLITTDQNVLGKFVRY